MLIVVDEFGVVLRFIKDMKCDVFNNILYYGFIIVICIYY